jgi:outer membrane protein assembly factor BamB
MNTPQKQFALNHGAATKAVSCLLLAASTLAAAATDWPQYRGPTHDGISTDRIQKQWATGSPGFLLWRNNSLTNGFSSFAVSQGRAFTLMSRNLGGMKEVCVALDAATGTQLWATPIDNATYDVGGDEGLSGSYYTGGDGPRSTPAVQAGRVFALSAHLHLLCLNATNGSVMWSNNLVTQLGASEPDPGWQNGASPRVDDDLIFVNLNSSYSGLTLVALRTTNGATAWSSQSEKLMQTTPVVATLYGVRQVLFTTATGVVSVNRNTGAFLWRHPYAFSPYPTAMGASPVVYSNLVFYAAGYGRGSAVVRINLTGNTWTTTNLWYKSTPALNYRSIWMTPVVHNGYLYGQFGDKNFVTAPLNCIEMETGVVKWSTNNFGQGGTILVDNNLLTLTEIGHLVLSQPNPEGYTELARYQAFTFTSSAPGKCWNAPAVADGRIYARGTRGGMAIDVSVPPLKMLTPQPMAGNRLQLWVGTTTGGAIATNRLAKMEIRATTNPALTLGNWTKLTNSLVLVGGQVRVDNVDSGPTRYFIATEQP